PEKKERGSTSAFGRQSWTFDPLLEHYSPAAPLPYPNVKCFNNIAEYESCLKGAGPSGEKRGEKTEERRVPAPLPGVIKTFLFHSYLNDLHTGSPLGELYCCVEERIRVKVDIRTFKGLRGVCSGFIVAFDKFWNLVRGHPFPHPYPSFPHPYPCPPPPLDRWLTQGSNVKGQESGTEGPQRRRSQKKVVSRPYGRVHTHHVNQLFIRGENVLLDQNDHLTQ
uniref:LSM11, U7 small nuclear RNA associated n=1 Tax=Oncorhynchus mykiss TaxID=8022 RepID=A0A8K9VC32_ONCMY